MLPSEERDDTPLEKGLEFQLPPLSMDVQMTDPPAANSFVPTRLKELMPARTNFSTRAHEAPSSKDLQMKLSEETMIALSLTNTWFPLSIGPPRSSHVFPLSLDRKKPNPPTA